MGRKRLESVFREAVDLKYRVFNGLFLDLPFPEARRAGILLPVLAGMIPEALAAGRSPREIVAEFFAEREPIADEDEQLALLFRFIQLVERQVVLFDALEDAAFPDIHDMEGLGTLNDVLHRLDTIGSRDKLENVVDTFHVRVVLTAHPTQFYPSRVLGIITDLADALRENNLTRSYELLLQLGKTRFRNRNKPTPMDEAQSLEWYLENVFYHAMPQIHGRVVSAVRRDPHRAGQTAPTIELGFWPGGDRDGNPFVDAATTKNVSAMLRASILRLYAADVEQIVRRLTFDGAKERIAEIAERLNATITAGERSGTGTVRGGLGAATTASEGSIAYERAEDLQADLVELIDHLEVKHDGLFRGLVEELLWKVVVFGFHFATLDLRQDSRVHGRAVAALLAADEDDTVPYDELVAALESGPDLSFADAVKRLNDPVLRDTVESIATARSIQASVGTRGVHRYIISNTRSARNVLEVLYLATVAGYAADAVALDIVPLFETVNDLAEAPEIMRRLYTTPFYRSHLARRSDTQQIMLGFSDGTKDGGYVTANWMIYRARERLTAVASEYGVRVVFFEGRGGPPARGGGKTHQFYRGMSPDSGREQIHLTIQGQTISSNFGTPDAARYNLEQLVTAVLENLLLGDEGSAMDDATRDLIERISESSLDAYRALKERPDFVPYLERITPLTFYGEANNASRPTSRGSSKALQLEDLRAIPFVGAWSQMKQNVPGFFGFGSALRRAIDDGFGDHLREMYRNQLFFRTLVENSMQSLSKVNYDVTRYLQRDGEFGDLWRTLADEANRTIDALLELSDSTSLLENDPVTARSIALRESIVRPVVVIQQYALERLRDRDLSDEARNAYRRLVIKSMAAIVNAGRNSV